MTDRTLMSVAKIKMVAAGNRVHLDNNDLRIVRAKGEYHSFCGRLETCLSMEVCIADEGQAIRPQ